MSETSEHEATIAAQAIEACLERRGVTSLGDGSDGRRAFLVPIGADGGEDRELVQVALAATGRGVVARVRARRLVPGPKLGKALGICNAWNRAHPTPRAVLGIGKDGKVGSIVLDAWMPAGAGVDDEMAGRFVDAVVAGTRRFWADPNVVEVTEVMPSKPADD